MTKILLVEDEREIRENLCDLLARQGYAIDAADLQEKALELLEDDSRCFDLALVDLYLGDKLGYAVCRAAKEKNIPVIFMTARDDEEVAAICIGMGADYVQKSRPVELLSRVRGVLDKSGKSTTHFYCRELHIDTTKPAAYKNGKNLELSPLELRILLVFVRNPDRLITREELKIEVWNMARGYVDYVTDDTVRTRIMGLRAKIEDDPKNPQYIQTVHGMGGYKFNS